MQNCRDLEICFDRVKKRKIKHSITELKASTATDKVRKAILKEINKHDIEIQAIVANTHHITNENQNNIYNKVTKVIVDEFQKIYSVQSLILDRRGSNMSRKTLDEYIKYDYPNLQIEHLDSYRNKIIQIVDFIAWAIRRKYEANEDVFYNLIADRTNIEIWKWP